MATEPEAIGGKVTDSTGEKMSPSQAEVRAMNLLARASEARAQRERAEAYLDRTLAVLLSLKTLHEREPNARVGHQEATRRAAGGDPEGLRLVWAQHPDLDQAAWTIPTELVPEWLPERSTPWDDQAAHVRNEKLTEYLSIDVTKGRREAPEGLISLS